MEALHLESRERNWMRCSGETLCLLKSCGLNRHIRGAKDGRSFDCYSERKEEAVFRRIGVLSIALGTKVVGFLDQGPRAFMIA